ncbi:hypothetical protein AB0O47_02060 [Streptomyces noursei]|uniref:hypothetical protein n=1 Tax=Streptomyces noursei TaxID=1971 RepID=UPI00344F0FCD
MLIAIEASVIIGFLAGILVVVLGMSPLSGVGVGGGTTVAVFTAAMTAIGYVSRSE